MVINDDEGVPTSAVDRRQKGPRKVDVNEPSGMRRCIQVVSVRQTRRIGFRARSAGGCGSMPQTVGSVRGVFREPLQARSTAVQSTVHEMSSVVCSHDLYV
eukprot:517277-Pleurochrysis_carterae.AAC.1